MEKIYLGQKIEITAFKHDEQMHRTWRKMSVIQFTDNEIVLANKFAKVFEATGKNWFTPEPAVSIFYKDRFYNVIAMLKNDGTYFYCNLSSPALIDEEGLKYIDYDIDVRVKPDFSYEILDEEEYKANIIKYEYSKDIQEVLEKTLNELIKKIEKKELPFDHKYIEELYFNYAVRI